jgi:prepilin-type N-terminal cleavage/methylation domain-containing protein
VAISAAVWRLANGTALALFTGMTSVARRGTPEAGFSLIEMMFVTGIMGVLAGIAVLQIGASRPGLVGDGGMRIVLSQMNQAREMAITQRRNMRVVFTGVNTVEVYREEVPGPTLTLVRTVPMEGGVQFLLTAGLPDTPDAFGNATAQAFGVATEVKFAPDGTLVNQSGATINGSVFLAIASNSLSARAVTVLGSTGRVRGYRWDGRVWKMV